MSSWAMFSCRWHTSSHVRTDGLYRWIAASIQSVSLVGTVDYLSDRARDVTLHDPPLLISRSSSVSIPVCFRFCFVSHHRRYSYSYPMAATASGADSVGVPKMPMHPSILGMVLLHDDDDDNNKQR